MSRPPTTSVVSFHHTVCLLLGLSTSCAAPQAQPGVLPTEREAAPSSPALPLDPKVTTGALDNGLTYFLERHKAKDKRAHLVLVVKAGSLYEEDDQRGLAHFVEHMAFNGTRRFEKETLVDFFEKSGLKFGSHANASTAYDRTQYMLSIPTDDPRLLMTALDVLEDWASGISFDPEEVQKERQVLLAEWTSSRGAARRVGEQHRQLLLAGSKFSEREVIGDKAVLESGPRERLVDFYESWYRPERMAVVVVGDIDPTAVQAAIVERFSRVARSPKSDGQVESPVFEVPVRQEPVAAVITDPETPATFVSVVLKSRARPVGTEQSQRDQIASVMAAQMLSRRLDALAENPKAPFTGAASSVAAGAFGCLDLVQISARAKEGSAQLTLDALLVELERLKRHGFVDTEVERVKQNFARDLERAVQAEATAEASAIATSLANQYVTGNIVTSAEFDRALGTRLLREISTAELNARAAAWFTQSEELLLVGGASRDAMPDKAHLLTALSAAAKQPVEAYRDEVLQIPLLAVPPIPGRIVKEEQVPEVGIEVWTLSNGARVVLKPTDFKDDQILGRAVSFGGDAVASSGDFQSARFATTIVMSSGVGSLSRQALGKAVTGTVASAQPWIDEQSEGIRASAAPKDVETMFQLVHLYMTAPRRDEAAFEAFRGTLREGLRNRDLNPLQVFSDAVAKEQWGTDPRRAAPTLANVDEIDLDRALGFYKGRFGDASDMTFVFVGAVDTQGFRPLVERYLASLPGAGRKEKPRDLGLHRKKGIIRVRVREGLEDKASVVLLYHGETPWSENAHTDLVSLQSYLSIRLREVLREQMGGVYTPAVSSEFERVPYDAYTLTIGFQCKVADIEKLERATQEVIAEVKAKGANGTYLTKLISQRTRDLEESYRDNDFWLSRLATQYKMGEDPRSILALHDLTRRVTGDNLRLAARHFLRDDQYVDARLMPK
jgi:zinc protease